MLTVFIRAIVLYILMILAIRAMGKRQLGQFQPYELAMALLISDLLATPMSDVSTPLLHGVLPIAALFVVHGTISILCLKSDRIRAFISGKPSVVINRGVIDKKQLSRLCLTLSDLLEGIRESGILDPADVGTAIIEANGKITAFPRSDQRPPTAAEINIQPAPDGLPLPLIMDGRVQDNNLLTAGLTRAWLEKKLAGRGADVPHIYFACLSTDGCMLVQEMSGRKYSLDALPPEKVAW